MAQQQDRLFLFHSDSGGPHPTSDGRRHRQFRLRSRARWRSWAGRLWTTRSESRLVVSGLLLCWLLVSGSSGPAALMGHPQDQDSADSTISAERQALKKHLYFHAPFDGGTEAKLAWTDGQLYTAPTLKRETAVAGQRREDVVILPGEGRNGDALRFLGKSKQVLFFPGSNLNYRARDWEGTMSVWLRLSPDQDLGEGYSDPLQITEKAWNDASFFIDFDIDRPRTFRLGVFADYRFWNPADTAWESIPAAERPMIHVPQPAMSRDRWTHVAWTFAGINAGDDRPAECQLFLDGELQGRLRRPLQFQWDLDRTAIMLGLDYIGDLDELMFFDRVLSNPEIQELRTFFNEN